MRNDFVCKIIAIGASAGGVLAIRRLLQLLPAAFGIPIVVVQHVPDRPVPVNVGLIYGTDACCRVREVEDKMKLEPGVVYMGCSGYHTLIERDGIVALSQDEPVRYSRPSIDVLFDSVARSYGATVCGVLLTGANSDGAEGLKRIHDAGGRTIVQDPAEADCPTMPSAALALFEPDAVLTIEGIAQQLARLQKPSLELTI